MNETLQELVEFLKTASPAVWEAAMRQVLALGYIYLIVGILALILTVYSIIVLVKLYKEWGLWKYFSNNSSYEQEIVYKQGHPILNIKDGGEIVFWFIAPMGGLGAVILIPDGILHLVNPTWYAIRLLISTVTGQ